MEYCPYCAEQILKPTKVCPNCKKSLDLDLLASMFKMGESTKSDKKIKKKIWFREHSHIIIPIITLLIGFVSGALILYGVAQAEFMTERSGYKAKIGELQKTIENNEKAAGSASQDFQKQLAHKDEIISVLDGQLENMSKVIIFTRRFSGRSSIKPLTPADSAYFVRNVRYLNRLFDEQQEKLKELGYENIRDYNLKTIPNILSYEN